MSYARRPGDREKTGRVPKLDPKKGGPEHEEDCAAGARGVSHTGVRIGRTAWPQSGRSSPLRITAPVMFFSARMNNREDFLERARQNQRPLPPMDARSEAQARATLEQALERGAIDESSIGRTRKTQTERRQVGSRCLQPDERTTVGSAARC